MTETGAVKKKLDRLYRQYNKRSYVHPDPLEFLYDFEDKREIEIVGLVASALAYGRVARILTSVSKILNIMGPSPQAYVRKSTYTSMNLDFKDFSHRFAKGGHMAALLFGVKRVLTRFGSLENCFARGLSRGNPGVLPGLDFLCDNLTSGRYKPGHLVAMPGKKSACKRMNLYLRWMIRKDAVDLGSWGNTSPAGLIVPLDTHMHRIGKILGFTERNAADMKTAVEITEGFKRLTPNDPVKYDFALTRFGIRENLTMDDFAQYMG